MTTKTHRILVSGAGVAGSTLAYWLAAHGFEVTVVERAAGDRSSGNPVDVRGPAVDVVERMGILPQLRTAQSQVNRLRFVDAAGSTRATIRTRAFQGSAGDREMEVSRSVLARILLSAARDRTEIRWGDSIIALNQAGDGVDVSFEQAEPEHFDLVVGADGLHSTVRRLAFGPERDFAHPLGMYVATLPVDRPFGGEHEVIVYNAPGRAISVHPGAGTPAVAFMFRDEARPGLDHREPAAHQSIVTAAYAGMAGVFEPFLDQVAAATDMFFDSVTRIELPHWSSGRVAVVGDAASCLSLLGDGSTLAIAGAHTLATELARTPDDPAGALHRYERRHRTLVRPKQRGFHLGLMFLVPQSRAGITVRDNVVRLAGRVLERV